MLFVYIVTSVRELILKYFFSEKTGFFGKCEFFKRHKQVVYRE